MRKATAWAILLGGLLSGCAVLRRTTNERTDQQIFTRREWAEQNSVATDSLQRSDNTSEKENSRNSTHGNRTPEATGARPGEERTASSVSARARKVVTTARIYLGTPYVYGGTTESGMDCSALIQRSYASVGIQLPRTSRDQGKIGRPISRSQVQVGDLLFFYASTPGVVGHVGIVTEVAKGDLQFIHAALNGGVRLDFLSNRHWSAHYLYARRIL